ncbi:MAG: PD40 domain-containing protein [Armatimonadetes bacterium]|nr:PD40 domain-containing protein [Armatimonadota bacterium]
MVSVGYGELMATDAELQDVTPDGRFVVFTSAEAVQGTATNGFRQFFVRDRFAGVTRPLLRILLDADAGNATISDDGEVVAFATAASNLVATDTNGVSDIFFATQEFNQFGIVTSGGNGASRNPRISGDGQYIVFQSKASNLVNGDTLGNQDVFRFQRSSYTTEVVSKNPISQFGNGDSSRPDTNYDGSIVVFQSVANNLTEFDSNGVEDAFVKDFSVGTIKCLSRKADGTYGNQASAGARVSGNGLVAFFETSATNLFANDLNNSKDIAANVLSNGSIACVSISGTFARGNGDSTDVDTNYYGTQITFKTLATNLLSSDTNNSFDFVYKDLLSGEVKNSSIRHNGFQTTMSSNDRGVGVIDGIGGCFSTSANQVVLGDNNNAVDVFVGLPDQNTCELVSASTEMNGPSAHPSISANGRYIAFDSGATNLVKNDTNSARDVFIRDMLTGEVILISKNPTSQALTNDDARNADMTPDGRYVVFQSAGNNLVVGDSNNVSDIFKYDTVNQTLTRVNLGPANTQANDASINPTISDDGRYVSFESLASNLTSTADTNGVKDIYLRDTVSNTTTRVSVSTSGGQTNGPSVDAAISGNGLYIAYESAATNIIATPTVNRGIFRYARAGANNIEISRSSANAEANDDCFNPSISALGDIVAFESRATNLAGGYAFASDIFVKDVPSNTVALASVNELGSVANRDCSHPALSEDGTRVAFATDSTSLSSENPAQNPVTMVREMSSGKIYVASITPFGGTATAVDTDLYSAISKDNKWIACTVSYFYLYAAEDYHDNVIIETPLYHYNVEGTLLLQDYVGAPQQVYFEFIQNGQFAEEHYVTIDPADPVYSIETELTGPVTIFVHGSHWLRRRRVADLSLGVPVNFSLINGDVDGDNSVTIFDYLVLSDYFDRNSGQIGWNHVGANGFAPKDADLDGDEAITIFDYLILSDNFDLNGD